MTLESPGTAGLAALLIFVGLAFVLAALHPFPVLRVLVACAVGGLSIGLGFRLGFAILRKRLKA